MFETKLDLVVVYVTVCLSNFTYPYVCTCMFSELAYDPIFINMVQILSSQDAKCVN